MTQENNQEAESAPQQDTVLGDKLSKAREAKKLSQIDLADKLNLDNNIIENLEAERFDELPAPAFVRGYIRAIALTLDLDVDETLTMYAQHKQLDPNLGSTSAAEKQRKSSDPAMVWGTLALLLLVVVLLLVWAFSSLGDQSPEQTELLETEALPEIELSLQQGSPLVLNDELTANTQQSEVLEPETEPAEVLEAPEEDTPASIVPKAPVGKDRLMITAQGSSWADIRDANGFKLVFGLLDKNDRQQELTGQAPFSVFLGDAKQVELEFQGKVFDHSRFIRANNVAKFSVK